jgi:PAS domain S-box-containing protein
MPTEKPDLTLEEQENILHAKQEWEHTFDAVSDLIFITDADHTIVRVNRTLAERCGLTPIELVGKKCYDVMHGVNSPPGNCLFATVLKCGIPQTSEIDVEKFHGIFEVTISPMFNSEGKIIAGVHITRDVTEKRRHEELLEAHQKQLEEINSSLESRIEKTVAELRNKDDILIQQSRLTAMGEMISNIAHQWRQPLNNIGLIVQNLQLAFKAKDLTEQQLDEDVAETMTIIQQISETINNFRNFFSYEKEVSSFIINEIVSRALSFVTPSLKSKGISVELDEQPDVAAVGYPNEYLQAFLNIILNARDALLEQQVGQPLISIRIFQENGRSVVTVCDNGGGIHEDILPKIFDPYFTTKQQCNGTGIGLYMAKMIVDKKMHGSLSARNVDGGAELRIEV